MPTLLFQSGEDLFHWPADFYDDGTYEVLIPTENVRAKCRDYDYGHWRWDAETNELKSEGGRVFGGNAQEAYLKYVARLVLG